MKKLLLLAALAAGYACAQPALVVVSSTLYHADGTPQQGTVTIYWQDFTSPDGFPVQAGSRNVTLTSAGLLQIALVPNVGATPTGTAYRVVYKLDLGLPETVAWTVPATGPVTVTAIQSTTLPQPSSIVALSQLGGVVNGSCLVGVLGVWTPEACGGVQQVGSFTTGHCLEVFGTGTPISVEDAGAPCGVGSGGSVFTGSTALKPAFSTTPTFSLADVSVKSPVRFEPGTLTGNVTAVAFTSVTAGAKFSIAWTQDGTGGRTVSYGGGVVNSCTISPAINITTTQQFEVGANGTAINGIGCVTNGTDDLVRTDTTNTFTSAGTLDLSAGTAAANLVLPTDASYVNGHCVKFVVTAGKFSLGDVSCGGGGGGGTRSIPLIMVAGNTQGFGITSNVASLTGIASTTWNNIPILTFPNTSTPQIQLAINLPADYSSGLSLTQDVIDPSFGGGNTRWIYTNGCPATGSTSITLGNSNTSATTAQASGGATFTATTAITTSGCTAGAWMVFNVQRDNSVGGNNGGAVGITRLSFTYTSAY